MRRRRECTACGFRFTTFERVGTTRLQVMKRDGRRQPFDCAEAPRRAGAGGAQAGRQRSSDRRHRRRRRGRGREARRGDSSGADQRALPRAARCNRPRRLLPVRRHAARVHPGNWGVTDARFRPTMRGSQSPAKTGGRQKTRRFLTMATTSTQTEGIKVERRHTTPGVHPFDEIEWEFRDAVIGDPENPAFEQRGVEFPVDVVAERHEHRRAEVLPGPDGLRRARVLGPPDDRPRLRHDRRVGPRGRLLRLRRGRRRLRGRAHPHPPPPEGRLQLSRLVQRRLRGAPTVLCLLHPLRRGHDGVDPRLEHQGGSDLPRRLRLGHQPLEHPRLRRAPLEGRPRLGPRLLHARRRRVGRHDQVGRQDPPRGEDGRPRHRPSGHRALHLVQGRGGGQGSRPPRRRLRHVDRR